MKKKSDDMLRERDLERKKSQKQEGKAKHFKAPQSVKVAIMLQVLSANRLKSSHCMRITLKLSIRKSSSTYWKKRP